MVKITLLDWSRCSHDENCRDFATQTHDQLAGGRYDWPASILQFGDFDEWQAQHRTARKRAARSARLGYDVSLISRADYLTEIHAINTSLPERQGRPMSDGYLSPPNFSRLPDYPCLRHRIDEWGCFRKDGRLVAYLVLYVCGELGMVSQILGHGDYLADDIMYLLMARALWGTLSVCGPLAVFYNLHDSGTDGLRYFKERLGFHAERVEWAL